MLANPSLSAALSFLVGFGLALPALAGPAGTSVERPPEGEGDAFIPGIRLVEDLPQAYVEEEFFVSGQATLYNYANDPPLSPTDIKEIGVDDWKTRIIVRRPEDPAAFNGSVVIEWWNSTAGFDSAPSWDPSAEYFGREGYIYVGVTNANQALSFLQGGCSLFNVLPPTCGTRYATLSLPEDGYAYEMVTAIAALLRSGAPDNPIPPEYAVERLYHTGQSQQGGSLVTYASAFHAPGVNDGYFIQANVFARSINAGPACGADGSPPFPGCTPRLEAGDRFVRTDLAVPVAQVLGETDVEVLFGTAGRQPDTPNFRYYETAGVAHLTIHKDTEIIPPPISLFLEDLCANAMNSSADGPVFGSYSYNAMWANLERQVRNGEVPPPGVVMDLDPGGAVARDEFGNALGGVRASEMDVPTGSYNPPTNQADPNLPDFLRMIGDLACFLAGSVTPFDDAMLAALYPSQNDYLGKVLRQTDGNQEAGFLLDADRQKVLEDAAASGVGCGSSCGDGFPAFSVVRRTAPRKPGFASTRGWSFTPEVPLRVTQLGFWDGLPNGLARSHEVGLWTAAGELLRRARVPQGHGAELRDGFRWVDVDPVALVPGETYVIGTTLFGPDPNLRKTDAKSLSFDPTVAFEGGARGLNVRRLRFPRNVETSDLKTILNANFKAEIGGPVFQPGSDGEVP